MKAKLKHLTAWAVFALTSTPALAAELSCPSSVISGCSDLFGALVADEVRVVGAPGIILEGAEPSTNMITVPAGSVDFIEPGVSAVVGVSDTVKWSQFTLSLTSAADMPGPGPDLPESFAISYRFSSDPNFTLTSAVPSVSDTLTERITLGGRLVAETTRATISERPDLEGPAVAMIDIPQQTFTLNELDATFSDTLTIGPLHFDLMSDLNDNNLLPASGEGVVLGETGDVLTIRVISDVPEPATLMLLEQQSQNPQPAFLRQGSKDAGGIR